MPGVDLLIFRQPAPLDQPPLTAFLTRARDELAERHGKLFQRAGAERVHLVSGAGGSFGERLVDVIRERRLERLVVLGAGSVPLLRVSDARRLVAAAAQAGRAALTNNRYSSDVCAISDASALVDLPPLPTDNALPRWLAERAGFRVAELPARGRLALDLDTPLDVAVAALHPGAPPVLRRLCEGAGIGVPRLDELRDLTGDPARELLVFGRSSSAALAWLERNVACRVRFLAEERGLRASTPLALGARGATSDVGRPPRATLGRLLALRGPAALADVVAELADGALLDSRVLLADRLGPDESGWPPPEDRFASDLLRYHAVSDSWLTALTEAAAGSKGPILLGGHTLVGPGLALICAPGVLQRGARRRPPTTPSEAGSRGPLR